MSSPVAGTGIWGVPVDDLKRVGDRVYVLYRRDIEGGYDVMWNTALYCATSLDGGANFTQNLMTTSGRRWSTNISPIDSRRPPTPPTWRWTAITSMWSGPRTNGYYTSNEIVPSISAGPRTRA